jgi:hypothetical protein
MNRYTLHVEPQRLPEVAQALTRYGWFEAPELVSESPSEVVLSLQPSEKLAPKLSDLLRGDGYTLEVDLYTLTGTVSAEGKWYALNLAAEPGRRCACKSD